jgi:hypothetical protein
MGGTKREKCEKGRTRKIKGKLNLKGEEYPTEAKKIQRTTY